MAERYPDMTTNQKRDCLALADRMEHVKTFPHGVEFIIDLFLAATSKQGLIVTDRKQHERLFTAAKALLTRRAEGPSEDPTIFAEWDDLADAVAKIEGSS